MCRHQCYIYSTVLLFWRLFRLYTQTHIIRKYRTIGIIGPPTPPISPFIRRYTVMVISFMDEWMDIILCMDQPNELKWMGGWINFLDVKK
jgi:hypothetical protein